MFGINVSNPVKQPIQSNSVGFWHMSHCGTSAFYCHFYHGFIVLKDIQHSFETRMCSAWWNVINWSDRDWCAWLESVFACLVECLPTSFPVALWHLWSCWFCFGMEWNTSITKSQRVRAEIPSMREPASREITSASEELCETEVCFSHLQLVGTNVWLPKMHRIPPDVDFESSNSPAKSDSWNNPNLHCCAVFPHHNIACIHMCDEKKRSNAPNVCHKLMSISLPHEQVCSQTIKISGLPIRAKKRHCRTICEQTVDNSPTDPLSFALNWWSSMHVVATL